MDQPLALRCGTTLRNRLCKVATSEHLGDARSNDATPLLTALYGRWAAGGWGLVITGNVMVCLLYTSPSPRDGLLSRMPSSA